MKCSAASHDILASGEANFQFVSVSSPMYSVYIECILIGGECATDFLGGKCQERENNSLKRIVSLEPGIRCIQFVSFFSGFCFAFRPFRRLVV